MSSLWTPSGEHVPDAGAEVGEAVPADQSPEHRPPHARSQEDPSPAARSKEDLELAEELRRVREELAATPVADIVANHAVGLWQLAVLHLTPDEGAAPNLEAAALAIDAMAGLVDGLGNRLGEHAEALRDALAQLRIAFVQVRDRIS